MPNMQELIHKLEVGPWVRHLKIGLAVLTLVCLFVGYNWRNFRNFNSQEAMDGAQVARQLAEGKGYTTLFIRPSSVRLVKARHQARAQSGTAETTRDPALIKDNAHPDLANAPVYPVLLAGLMKVFPLNWETETTKPFWSSAGGFWRYQPDFLISLFNQVLFLPVVVLTFLLARRLFDPAVAWTSALLLLTAELFWRFSVSGLSTILLLLIFVGLAWLLVWFEEEARESKRGPRALFLLAAGLGLILGLGMLTRYSFGWLLLPVVAYVAIFGGQRRALLCVAVVVVFTLVVTPWIYRNLNVSGLPFGTATYAAIQDTPAAPGYQQERSLTPDLSLGALGQEGWAKFWIKTFVHKLTKNSREILWETLPHLGGSWLAALFLAGLLLGFRNQAIRRLRYFLLMSLGTLIVVQAWGRTQLSADSPGFNSENLIVLAVPIVFIYGVGLFYQLLDQMNLPYQGFRIVVIGAFCGIMMLPMLFSFLTPRASPVVFPPYHPHAIRQLSGLMKEPELIMSDVPWAVAWYGQRQCIWLSRDTGDEFFAVNDYLKPVSAIYLTPVTTDAPFASEWVPHAGARTWGAFLLETALTRRAIPPGFPLREAYPGLLPKQFFLTDRRRWEEKRLPETLAPEVSPPTRKSPAETPKQP